MPNHMGTVMRKNLGENGKHVLFAGTRDSISSDSSAAFSSLIESGSLKPQVSNPDVPSTLFMARHGGPLTPK